MIDDPSDFLVRGKTGVIICDYGDGEGAWGVELDGNESGTIVPLKDDELEETPGGRYGWNCTNRPSRDGDSSPDGGKE